MILKFFLNSTILNTSTEEFNNMQNCKASKRILFCRYKMAWSIVSLDLNVSEVSDYTCAQKSIISLDVVSDYLSCVKKIRSFRFVYLVLSWVILFSLLSNKLYNEIHVPFRFSLYDYDIDMQCNYYNKLTLSFPSLEKNVVSELKK